MKKNLLSIGIIAVLVVAIVGGTWAWFTASSGPVTNNFKAGTVDIELTKGVASENAKFDNWNPGDSNTLTYTFKNTGSKDLRFRVKFDKTWELRGEDEDKLSTDNVILKFPNDKWDLQDDGYLYYNGILSADASVGLEVGIVLSGADTKNVYQGRAFELKASAQAIQASHQSEEVDDGGWDWKDWNDYK